MKHTFRYILSSVAMLLPALAFAQTELPDPPIYDGYNIKGGVGTKKSVGDAETGGLYTLTLETFATGKTEVVEKSVPADIVLVLDVSGSMEDDMPGSTYYYYSTNQSWTPTLLGTGNGSGNTDWYYKDENGGYHQIYRQRDGSYWQGYTYRYRVTINNQYRYLTNTGLQADASYVNANSTVWIGPLYERDNSKIAALKQAVEAFINEVNHNALYDKDNKLRDTPVSHQISVVKFAADRYCNANGNSMGEPYTYDGQYSNVITPGNHRGAKGNNNYNYTEVLSSFTNVSTSTGVNSLVSAVNGINEGGATASHFGMMKARYLLETVKNRESTKVVVMFTDGIPGLSGWEDDFANGAISVANLIKKGTDQGGYGALVYTIGVFSNLGSDATRVSNYMNYVSSNYPAAESMTDAGEGSDLGFYQDASSSSADLTAIFKSIASSASQTDANVEATTQVVDVVSNSFEVPSTFTANDVVVYTRAINTAGDEWGPKVTLTKVNLTDDPNFDPTVAPPADAEYMTDENKVGVYLKDGKLIILGFNYSKVDSNGADGSTAHPYDGNWVGFRKQNVAAGKELVIEFKIEADPNATGGDGTNTNSPDSGVYTLVDGEYVNINSYVVPHTDLPINIVIEKSGLRAGESATVQIYRCHQKKVNGVVQYNERTGKPLPEKPMPTVGQDPEKDCGWENFTKVILTNTTGQDLHPVTKELLALYADYVYLLVEDNWGWAYILDDAIMSTDEVEKNPFRFTNTENPDAVKHAEAAAINHFGDGYTDTERVKTYKSSKGIMNSNSGNSE